MKAAFSAEAIGLNASDAKTAKMFGISKEMHRMRKPWVAEITGVSAKYGYQRAFLRHKDDYKRANNAGTRGVHVWWTLESGRVYETRYPVSWKHMEHRFLSVTDDGDIVDMTEEEVRAWLASKASGSTS